VSGSSSISITSGSMGSGVVPAPKTSLGGLLPSYADPWWVIEGSYKSLAKT
jgi:hypothetical protein